MADKLGTFYGVGVGPGDPELLTLKAVRVLESCPVLAAPQMASGEMTALSIARQAARLEGKTLLPLRFTMSRDRAEQAEGHRRAADAVRPYLEAGQDVAMAILGDVSIYSTYCYMMELLKAEGFPCVMVPGVPSFCAVAARLGRSLTEELEARKLLDRAAMVENCGLPEERPFADLTGKPDSNGYFTTVIIP